MKEWNNVSIGGGGYITGIVIHPKNPKVVYIRTDVGGIFKWNDERKQWSAITDIFSINQRPYYSIDGIALDPNNDNIVYMCAGNKQLSSIFKSYDGGKSWSKLKDTSFDGNGLLRYFGEPIQVDPKDSNIIYTGTRNDGLIRSSDGGKTWVKIKDVPLGIKGIGIRAIALDINSVFNNQSSTIYVAVYNNGIYKSIDGGDSFTYIHGSPRKPSQLVIGRDGSLFVTSSEGLFKYNDRWIDISPAPLPFNAIDVAPNDPKRIIVVVDRSIKKSSKHKLPIYLTLDGGKSWLSIIDKSTVNYSVPWYSKERFSSATASIKFDPQNTNKVFLTDWYQVMITEDINAKQVIWNQSVKGIEETVVYAMISLPQLQPNSAKLLSFVADNSGFRHTSITDYPNRKINFTDGNGLDYCESNPNYVFGVSGKRNKANTALSTDNGASWIKIDCPFGQLAKVAYSATDKDRIVVVPKDDVPIITTDRGRTWHRTSGAPKGSVISVTSPRIPIASDRVNGLVFYLLHSNGDFYKSINGGEHWKKTTTLKVKGNYILKAVPGIPGEVWCAGTSGGLYRSTTYGDNFSKIANVENATLIAFGKNKSDSNYPAIYIYGFIDGVIGLFQSTNQGSSWLRIDDESKQIGPAPSIMEADRDKYGKVYIATRGRGIFYTK